MAGKSVARREGAKVVWLQTEEGARRSQEERCGQGVREKREPQVEDGAGCHRGNIDPVEVTNQVPAARLRHACHCFPIVCALPMMTRGQRTCRVISVGLNAAATLQALNQSRDCPRCWSVVTHDPRWQMCNAATPSTNSKSNPIAIPFAGIVAAGAAGNGSSCSREAFNGQQRHFTHFVPAPYVHTHITVITAVLIASAFSVSSQSSPCTLQP